MFFFLFLIVFNIRALEPSGYEKKPEIKTSVERIGSHVHFQYGFKDLRGKYQEWSWQDDFLRLKNLSDQFGVNAQVLKRIQDPDVDLNQGLFIKHPLLGIIPDYNKLISLHQKSVLEIYRNWMSSVESQKLDRRESINYLLRFLQDYPYGIPPAIIGEKYIAGLLVPSLSLVTGWADCDSKSLLMATILSLDSFFKDKMAMILVPGHALLGIELISNPYDEIFEYQNRTFIVAEPTGLSRTPFGKKNSPYSSPIAIVPLYVEEMTQGNVLSSDNGLKALIESDCPEGGLLVDFFSTIENSKVQVCMIKSGNGFIKHGPLLKYDSTGIPKEKEIYSRGLKI